MIKFEQKLMRTPRDDWDLRPRRFRLELEPGVVQEFRFNQLAIENQVGQHITAKYGWGTVAAAHLRRYFEAVWFFNKHRRRFEREGFIRDCDEPGKIEVNDRLLHALAVSPFAATRSRGKHRWPTFDLAAILTLTRQLVQEEEGR